MGQKGQTHHRNDTAEAQPFPTNSILDSDSLNIREQGSKTRDSGIVSSSYIDKSNKHQDNKYPPEEDLFERDDQAQLF